jgi:hypothetical protein
MLKQIIISKHAVETCGKRGVSADEVELAVQRGTRETAKHDRIKCRLNFEYNSTWEGKYYSIKQVAPIIVEEQDQIVVITVYAYYF